MDIKQQIEAANFDYANGVITAANFPEPQEPVDISGFQLLETKAGMSADDALAAIAKSKMRAANVYELVEWKKQHGEDVPPGSWVVAFGQTWQNGEKGRRRMPFVVYDEAGFFTLSLGFYDSELRGHAEYLLVLPN